MLIKGAYNVRDIGGYTTKDNKTVKKGKILRSGDLNTLTSDDLTCFENFGLKTIIDFRMADEQELAPSKFASTVKKNHCLSIDAAKLINLNTIKDVAESHQSMNNAYKFFVEDSKSQYQEFFKILMDENSAPLLFHCSAGKDRTGFAGALLLASLNVDIDTIYQDYLLSAPRVQEKYASFREKYPHLAPVTSVEKEYLETALNLIDKKYGGIENYLTQELNVDLDLMRKLYTE